jgi:hypothetical protein
MYNLLVKGGVFMTDAEIKSAVSAFRSNAAPISTNSADPATVKDIKRLIDATSELFKLLAK